MSRKYDVQISRVKRQKLRLGNAFPPFFSPLFPHSPPRYYFIDALGFLVIYIVDSALRHSAHCPAPSFRITNHGQRNVGSRLITSQFAEFTCQLPTCRLSSHHVDSDQMSHRSLITTQFIMCVKNNKTKVL